MISGILAYVQFIVDPVDPRDFPVVISQITECIIRKQNNKNRHIWQLAESPCLFPDLWRLSHSGGKSQVEATKTASTQKNREQNNMHTWRGCRD